MHKLKKKKYQLKKIVKFLKARYDGPDFTIAGVSSLNHPKNNSLLFYTPIINSKLER